MTDMATTDAAFGFQPYEEVLSAHWYAVVTNVSVALYIGAAVEVGGTAITTARRGTIQNVASE